MLNVWTYFGRNINAVSRRENADINANQRSISAPYRIRMLRRWTRSLQIVYFVIVYNSMSTQPGLTPEEAQSTWGTETNRPNIPNAIIIAKLVILYEFIKTVVGENGVNTLKTIIVNLKLYESQTTTYLNQSNSDVDISNIDEVAKHIISSFTTCVKKLKPGETPRGIENLLMNALGLFRNAMLNPTSAESLQYFSELQTLSNLWKINNNPFNNIEIKAIQTKLAELYQYTLNRYLNITTGLVSIVIIKSILCGSLVLASKMSQPPPDKKNKSGWFSNGGTKGRRRRQRRNRKTSRRRK